jgi:hemolysin III
MAWAASSPWPRCRSSCNAQRASAALGAGRSLFGVVWVAAALGATAKLLDRLRHPLWSTGLYVAMGWVAIVAVAPLVERMSGPGLGWLVAGGLSCTAGAVAFLFDSKLRYAHFVWHLFVMVGSTCHFFAALWHAGT